MVRKTPRIPGSHANRASSSYLKYLAQHPLRKFLCHEQFDILDSTKTSLMTLKKALIKERKDAKMTESN